MLPEPNIIDHKLSSLDRWQIIQQMQQRFWKGWQNDYLNTLQQRKKWLQECQNIEVGDLVILKEDNIPPSKWLLARVTEVYTGSRGLVRVVQVQTKNGTFKRAVHKVCPLPVKASINDQETDEETQEESERIISNHA